jgi:hypothetical protein
MSDFLATSVTVVIGIPPISFNESPRDNVRLVKIKGGDDVAVRCFCRFLAIPIPIEPKPIHPT